MEIEKIWQNLEKKATEIMIFLPHYTWAKNKEQNLIKIVCKSHKNQNLDRKPNDTQRS